MYCKKCGYNISDDKLVCPFCNTVVEKENKYSDYVKLDETKEANGIRNNLGYVKLKTNWFLHILIACAGYLAMNVLFTVVSAILIAYYRSAGNDFSCVSQGNCSMEINNLVNKITAISQVISELFIVAIVILIFHKHIKTFFKNFKDKKTYKWYGIGLAIMYGFNFVYSIFLMLLDSSGSSTNQEGVNTILKTYPLLGFFFVVIAAPLFEEIIFRFGIFRAFTHKGKKAEVLGLILTTVLFAGVHLIATFEAVFADPAWPNWEIFKEDALSIPIYLSGAFAMTFAYYKSKNLNTSILMHLTWNFLAFISIMTS